MKKEDFDILEIIDLILGAILVIALIVFILEIKELHDDYKCTTITTDAKYYDEHNCKRFER